MANQRYSIDYLKQLLELCGSQSVFKLEMPGLLVEFGPPKVNQPAAQAPAQDQNSTEKIAEVLRKQEESLPPDLRADDIMNHDKVLNWSSPDAQDLQIPLAADGDL